MAKETGILTTALMTVAALGGVAAAGYALQSDHPDEEIVNVLKSKGFREIKVTDTSAGERLSNIFSCGKHSFRRHFEAVDADARKVSGMSCKPRYFSRPPKIIFAKRTP